MKIKFITNPNIYIYIGEQAFFCVSSNRTSFFYFMLIFFLLNLFYASFVYLLQSSFFLNDFFLKINYFLMFGSVIENKLKNTFQYLVM
jgi:hypothetical protein